MLPLRHRAPHWKRILWAQHINATTQHLVPRKTCVNGVNIEFLHRLRSSGNCSGAHAPVASYRAPSEWWLGSAWLYERTKLMSTQQCVPPDHVPCWRGAMIHWETCALRRHESAIFLLFPLVITVCCMFVCASVVCVKFPVTLKGRTVPAGMACEQTLVWQWGAVLFHWWATVSPYSPAVLDCL